MPFKAVQRIEGYQEVSTFSELPDAGEYEGDIYIVLTPSGVWGVNRKRAGAYLSNGSDWVRLGVLPTQEEYKVIMSDPPSGKYRVTNIYVTQHPGGVTQVEYDDTPVP